MDIIMIRHGETEDNVKKVFSRTDTGLTKEGIEQTKEIKKNLEKLSYDKIYYSPLIRIAETLKILELEGVSETRIREIDFGIFAGKSFEEISRIYPNECKSWMEDMNNYTIPEGESLINLYSRVKEYLEEVSKKDENILLITHEGIIRSVLCWVFDDINYFSKFKIGNGSVNIVSIEDGFKYIKK